MKLGRPSFFSKSDKSFSSSALSNGSAVKPAAGGRLHRMDIDLLVKQLIDCPLNGRELCVKLKWGKSTVLGRVRAETCTASKTCTNRTVQWTEEAFKYRCNVFLEDFDPAVKRQLSDADRERLLKKQPSSAFLRMSLRRDSERSFSKHKRYGYLDVNLMDWAMSFGDGKTHSHRFLLDGTSSTARLEMDITVTIGSHEPAGSRSLDDPLADSKFDNAYSGNVSRTSIDGEDMEDCDEGPRARTEFWNVGVDEDQKLTKSQMQFLSSGAPSLQLRSGNTDDKVLRAVLDTRLTPDQTSKVVKDIWQNFLDNQARMQLLQIKI